MIHPDTDARRMLVRERHAALARDADPSPVRRADRVGVRRAERGFAALPRFLVLRLAGRRP